MDHWADIPIAIFLAGVIFYAGMLAARVSALEDWRKEMHDTLDEIHKAIRRLGRDAASGEE